MSDPYRDLADSLDAIAAELDERSFEMLRAAVADGEVERPPADRTITQARRSIEKAAGLLRRSGSGEPRGVDEPA